MALPFDTPGKLERRIAQGMADQSSDSSLGALATGTRHGSNPNSRRIGGGGSHGGATGAYYFGDEHGDGGHSILSVSSSASWEAQGNDENQSRGQSNGSRKISPMPKLSVLGERSLNSISSPKQGPTLVKAVALSRQTDVNDLEDSPQQERRFRSTRGPPSVASSHASSSDIRVRSPPLSSTPHPLHGALHSSPTRSMSLSQRSSASLRSSSGMGQQASRPASAQDSLSRTASAAFRSAVEESPLARSRSSNSSGAETISPADKPDESTHGSSGSDGSVGSSPARLRAAALPTQGLKEVEPVMLPKSNNNWDEETSAADRDAQSDQTMSPEVARQVRASGSQNQAPQPAATPRPGKIDQDYMRSYFLSAVKTSDPVRDAQLKQMTPRPNPLQRFQNGRLGHSASRALAALPAHLRQQGILGEASTSYAESSHSDASSTCDLTVPAHLAGRGNSSLPDTGPELNAAGPAARVDAARLQAYLHKINLQLEGENVALRDEQDDLRRQYDRALLDNEKLRKQLEVGGSKSLPLPSHKLTAEVQTDQHAIAEVQRLGTLLQERDAEIEALRRRTVGASDNTMQDHIAELEDELEDERQAAKAERDRFDEIIQLAKHETDQALSAAEDRFLDERDKLAQEIDELRNALERQPADQSSASQESETARLRGNLYRTQAQLDDHNAQLDDALQQVEYLERQLAERYDLQRAAENQVEDCKVALAELEAEVVEIRNQLDLHKKEAEEAKDKAFDLGIAVEEKQSDVIRLEMLLRQAQDAPEVTRLKERVTLLESQLDVARQSIEASSHNIAAGQGATPVHRSIAALRKPIATPKSPAELSSASWLYHDSTLGEKAVLRDIAALRGEVDAAHKATDDIIAQLSTAQMAERIVQLHTELERMQEEAAHQHEQQDRFRRRLERIKCGQCKTHLAGIDLDTSVDATVTVTGANSTRANDTMRTSSQKEQVLAEVAQQLSDLKTSWAVDQARLAAERQALDDARKDFDSEKAQLEDENRRMRRQQRAQDRNAREQAKHSHEGTLHDLGRARRIIGDFERDFREDFARFQEILVSSEGTKQQRAEIERELEASRLKLSDVEKELRDKVTAFEKLEMELFETSQMDVQLPKQLQHLESDVRRFSIEVEGLRDERDKMLEKRQILFSRRRKTQQDSLGIHEELKSAREAVFMHQQQLDKQVRTIEKLHSTLRQQSKELENANDDRNRLQSQRQAILTDLSALEADLRRVRDESHRFGQDLAEMRRARSSHVAGGTAETHDLMSLRKQHQAELVRMIEQQATHDADLRVRHKAQCRSLLLQIRYEKAKFMRESDLRADLVHQKKYILGVLGGLEMTEEATVRFLANIEQSRLVKGTASKGRAPQRRYADKETTPATRRDAARTRFRAAGFAVVAICRAQLMARNWRTALTVKAALREAHQMQQPASKKA